MIGLLMKDSLVTSKPQSNTHPPETSPPGAAHNGFYGDPTHLRAAPGSNGHHSNGKYMPEPPLSKTHKLLALLLRHDDARRKYFEGCHFTTPELRAVQHHEIRELAGPEAEAIFSAVFRSGSALDGTE